MIRERWRGLHVVVDALLGVFAIAAIAFSVRWAFGIIEAFQPGFNDHGATLDGYPFRIAVLGIAGIAAALIAAGAAFAYIKTKAPQWIYGVLVGFLSAVALFVVWIDIWEYAGGVG